MYSQAILESTRSATSSQDRASGHMPCDVPAFQTLSLFGPAPAHANLSARQAKARGLLTSGTFGRRSTTSSSSAALQKSMVSRLQARTQNLGSTLYQLTWKPWVMPSGRSLSRLRASALRTSETACIGWPTPTTRDHKDSGDLSGSMVRRDGKARNDTLPRALWLHLIGNQRNPSAEQMEWFVSCHLYMARWLMALPAGWDACAPTATGSTLQRQKHSFAA